MPWNQSRPRAAHPNQGSPAVSPDRQALPPALYSKRLIAATGFRASGDRDRRGAFGPGLSHRNLLPSVPVYTIGWRVGAKS